jgi:2,3-bisphosphoglycerate-independent phosphoglycerate mutase
LDAAIRACEFLDGCVNRVVSAIQSKGGRVLITADHGNAEQMLDSHGHPHTAHTLNPVPLILVDDSNRQVTLKPGVLGDVAPTILQLMEIAQPPQMTGRSLIVSSS